MSRLPVEVVRSTRRRKTVSAEIRQGVLVVRIPARMSRSDERMWVERMQDRLQSAPTAGGDSDLIERASRLAVRHGLPVPASVRWANQPTRWGSATPLDRSIRINRQLQHQPDWVLDYVLVHEIAHLEIPDHSPEFWELVARYPLAERARGFLLGLESVRTG
jgi:predicted metal-dependent hydrolase